VRIAVEPHDEPAIDPNIQSAMEVDEGTHAAADTVIREAEPTGRYNTRKIVRDYRNIQRVYNISVKKALQEYPEAARKAIIGELEQLVKKDCFDPVTADQLDSNRRRKLIRSFMFLKIKNRPDGTFDKLKARLVANGSQQTPSVAQQLANSSPTATLTSLLIVSAIAAREKRQVVTIDVKSTYINARMPDDDIVDILIEPSIATELVKLHKEFAVSLRPDGNLIVKLRGALYGTQQAAKLWYLDISTYLLELGFSTNDKDCCVFNLGDPDPQLTVVLYVDDLKLTSVCADKIDWLVEKLEDKYEEITVNRGLVHHYLGMTFDYSNGLKISMSKYEADLVEGIRASVTTPAIDHLFDVAPGAIPLNEAEHKEFHTLVAKLLFMAKRTRPDILLPVAYLSTRIQSSTDDDFRKLKRILAYLKGNRNYHLRLEASLNDPLVPYNAHNALIAYTDASHGVHPDRRSHSGAVILVFRLPVSVASRKQSTTALSSFEAELLALSDEAKDVVWCQDFLASQTGSPVHATLYCDNRGLVDSLYRESGMTQTKAKHIPIRHYWLRECIKDGNMSVVHVGTNDMWADMLTKPLQGEHFRQLRNNLVGTLSVSDPEA
jgi:hypothetical protein